MKKLVFALLLGLLVQDCSELYENPEQVYLIEEGRHDSKVVAGFVGDKLRTLKSSTLRFTARFDESARYNLGNKNQEDINKLFGFADANSMHHDNSIRFGWRYSAQKDQVEIFAYAYQNGQMNFEYITDLQIGANALFQINLTDESYELAVNGDHTVTMERKGKDKLGVYYLLFPYFGGNETAPHDIRIYINERV